MTISKEILDFLTQTENLQVALEIANYVKELLDQTHHDFWDSVNLEVACRMDNSPYNTKWSWEQFSIYRLRTEWQKAYFTPRDKMPDVPFLQLAFGQAGRGNNFRPFYGVTWNQKPGNFDHPQLTKLKGMVIANGMTVMEPPLWLGWNYLPYLPASHEFIQRMYTNQQGLIQEAVQIVWDVFTKLEPEMDAINRIRLEGRL